LAIGFNHVPIKRYLESLLLSLVEATRTGKDTTILLYRRKLVGLELMAFEIIVHEAAVEELEALRMFDQRIIVDAIGEQFKQLRTGHAVKSISVTDARANMEAVLDSAQEERIVITRAGRPSAVIVGIEGYDQEDLQLATSPEFWRMIEERRHRGSSISLAEVRARLEMKEQPQRIGKNSKRSQNKGKRSGNSRSRPVRRANP
jgi:prevent-host-death family protein